MGEELDQKVLALVGQLLSVDTADAMLVQGLWKDREALVEGMRLIEGWDTGHSEALSVARCMKIAEEALAAVGESE